MSASLKGQLAKGSSKVSVITFLGHILSTGLKLMVSRSYGVAGFGKFALVMALSRFLSTVIQMGLNQSIVHFLSKFRNRLAGENMQRFFAAGLRTLLVSSMLWLVIFWIAQRWIFKFTDLDQGDTQFLFIVWATSSAIALNNYLSASLRSLKRFSAQAVLFTSAFPLLLILAYVSLFLLQGSTPDLAQFFTLGLILNFILLFVISIYSRALIAKVAQNDTQDEPIKQLQVYSLPIWASTALQSASRSADRIMLGLLASLGQVGIYGAGLTFSILFAFPLKAMSPVFQPFIIEAYDSNDPEKMNELYNTMIRWSALFVIPMLGFVICFGDYLLLLFGKDFTEAYGVLIVLSLAQSISSISGIAGTMLDLTDKQGTHARIMSLGFFLTLVLNAILITLFGALGAALTTALVILLVNGLRVRKLIKFYNLDVQVWHVFKLALYFVPLMVGVTLLSQGVNASLFIPMLIYILIGSGIVFYSLEVSERKKLLGYVKRGSS